MADWLVGRIVISSPAWAPYPWKPEELRAVPADVAKNIKVLSLDEAMALAEATMSDPLGQGKRA